MNSTFDLRKMYLGKLDVFPAREAAGLSPCEGVLPPTDPAVHSLLLQSWAAQNNLLRQAKPIGNGSLAIAYSGCLGFRVAQEWTLPVSPREGELRHMRVATILPRRYARRQGNI